LSIPVPLTTEAPTTAGSATQTTKGTGSLRDKFKVLVENIQYLFKNKQTTLVSGTNIRTVNGNTLLGSSNLTISNNDPRFITHTVFNNTGGGHVFTIGTASNYSYTSTNYLRIEACVSDEYDYALITAYICVDINGALVVVVPTKVATNTGHVDIAITISSSTISLTTSTRYRTRLAYIVTTLGMTFTPSYP
jgi:hypothetical protein